MRGKGRKNGMYCYKELLGNYEIGRVKLRWEVKGQGRAGMREG